MTNGETWELETDMQEKYLELFKNKCMNFEIEILLRRGECDTPDFCVRERECDDDLKICSYFLIIPSYFE